MSKLYPVIGLEIHVELNTASKMFCQCSANYFGKKPNSNTCPVCLGLPGALPVPNKLALEYTIMIAQALNCNINKKTKFDRKHYFYPDLPKGYQISQYDEPVGVSGFLEVDIKEADGYVTKKFGITRVHIEEDTGKLSHIDNDTLVDFNRSSVPLVEIVTEPDFESSVDVKFFLEELHSIIKTLNVSDANMEKGSMRMEPNISLSIYADIKTRKNNLPNYKVEVKNINSFNFAKKAIDYEIKRQTEILESNSIPQQETRGYNEETGKTFSQRKKENAMDYRYFPDPDIPEIEFSPEYILSVKTQIPELPGNKKKRFVNSYKLKEDDARIISKDHNLSLFFEEVLRELKFHTNPKTPQILANCIVNKKIPLNLNKEEFLKKFNELQKPKETDINSLNSAISLVFKTNEAQLKQYREGKTTLLAFFIGQVLKELKGKADPVIVKAELIKKLAQ